ncbi:hypothetical protein P9250_20510 [Caballeronia sp. LP006]|uniref:hypothetical protein n=1 Tax=unclassified Caballeronia TaxID=2646786 RepID=UPI00285C054A|nr:MULTISPECIES: hypothetical protein [unclassified Caballeronia]MDR5770513.1 hypothetical protein [Caballeronia sp. LZ002]MDR5830259.1 hypothetical protein [Caballeronia sp. LP006]MDR5845950.1 hypothetical protein [Caballeronia sp. LZ003]
MEAAVQHVLDALRDAEPLRAKALEKEKKPQHQKRKRLTSIVFYGGFFVVFLAGFFAWMAKHQFLPGRTGWLLTFTVVWLIWLVSNLVIAWPESGQLKLAFQFRQYENLRERKEFEHDMTFASRLAAFPTADLQSATEWIRIVSERRKAAIARCIGSVDKIALSALVATLVEASGTLKGVDAIIHFKSFEAAAAGLVALGTTSTQVGFAIGALFLSSVVARYDYHRDLLSLAMRIQDFHN